MLIDPEKVAVDGENVLITSENPLIEAVIDGLNANKNTTTAVGNLINKLKEAELIEPVIGQGKGKYKFAEPKK